MHNAVLVSVFVASVCVPGVGLTEGSRHLDRGTHWVAMQSAMDDPAPDAPEAQTMSDETAQDDGAAFRMSLLARGTYVPQEQ